MSSWKGDKYHSCSCSAIYIYHSWTSAGSYKYHIENRNAKMKTRKNQQISVSELTYVYCLAPVLHGGEQLGVGTAWGCHRLEGLDELLLLPLIGQACVEVRGRETEQPLVLVRSG